MLYVTCSGETGNNSQRLVSHYVGINSAGYFYPIQWLRAILARSLGIPFQQPRLTLTIIKLVTHECTAWMAVCIVNVMAECIGLGHRVGPTLVMQYSVQLKGKHLPSDLFPLTPEQVTYEANCVIFSGKFWISNLAQYSLSDWCNTRLNAHAF